MEAMDKRMQSFKSHSTRELALYAPGQNWLGTPLNGIFEKNKAKLVTRSNSKSPVSIITAAAHCYFFISHRLRMSISPSCPAPFPSVKVTVFSKLRQRTSHRSPFNLHNTRTDPFQARGTFASSWLSIGTVRRCGTGVTALMPFNS